MFALCKDLDICQANIASIILLADNSDANY